MRHWSLRLLASVLIASFACGWEPVRLSPQPQKFRTFYELDDPRVPAGLRRPAALFPVGDITSWATASDGAVWYGTSAGLVRYDGGAAERDRIQYFEGRRYLPDDRVLKLVPGSSAGVWVRTHSGISHIELRLLSLERKAELFEERIRRRHDRHGLVAPSHLRVPGDVSTSRTRDDDNDGLWTSMYAAAECFRYAVTRSPEALANAKKSTEAVLFLEEVTGKRGFPARSYIRRGEPMPQGGEWHWTDDGKYYWKGDTSSDEIVGHFFLYSVATDLLPVPELKKRIRETSARIIDHILSHGYELIDVDGKPTRWGRWSEQYFREDPADSTLNSLELLSFLKSAAHITGDPRYEREYRKAAINMGYARQATRYLELRQEINYSDEELAMLPLYCLFRHEKDPEMLNRYYRPALDQWWENMVREENPLWTFIYLTGHPDSDADLKAAVRTLYRMPVDTIEWSVKNSQRKDVAMDTGLDRFQHPQSKTLLPPDERPAMKWNTNPFVIDGGNPAEEDDGAAFLLPYWMGRWHKFLLGS